MMTRGSNIDETNIRRWIVNLDQANRIFGNHRDSDVEPEEPARKLEEVTDDALAELEE